MYIIICSSIIVHSVRIRRIICIPSCILCLRQQMHPLDHVFPSPPLRLYFLRTWRFQWDICGHSAACRRDVRCQVIVWLRRVIEQQKVVLEEIIKRLHLIHCQLREYRLAEVLGGFAFARVLPLRRNDTRQ